MTFLRKPFFAVALTLFLSGTAANANSLAFTFSGENDRGTIHGTFSGVDVDGDGWIRSGLFIDSPDTVSSVTASGVLYSFSFDWGCTFEPGDDCLAERRYSFDSARSYWTSFEVKTDLSSYSLSFTDSGSDQLDVTNGVATASIIIDGRYENVLGTRQIPVETNVVPLPAALHLLLLGVGALGWMRRLPSLVVVVAPHRTISRCLG